MFAAGTDTGMFDRLDELGSPVRLLVSDYSGELEDPIRALEGRIPNSTTSYLTGDTHMVVMENPDRIASEVVQFLRRLTRHLLARKARSGRAYPPNLDYSGFPHTEAFNTRSTRVLGKIPPFTRQVNLYTVPGCETPIVILPGQGENMVDSTHPPNPHP